MGYGLKLSERDENDDPTYFDLDNIYHKILERIVEQLVRRKRDFSALSADEAQRLVRTYAQQIGESLRGELMLSTARNRYLLSHIEKTLEAVIAHQKALAERGQFRPAHVNLSFGNDAHGLPPLLVTTPAGRELQLHGHIDRVDVLADEAAFAVMDYRLTHGDLSLGRVEHGLALRLVTYLLVLQAHGEKLAGRKLTPAAAFYVRLLRQMGSVEHPGDAEDPSTPEFHLKSKPRGILDARFTQAFDRELKPGPSDAIQAYLKTDGTFSTSKSDTADPAEFRALLQMVEQKMGELADQILDGHIGLNPYRIGTSSPCPRCGYRDVCRFDPGLNRYHYLNIALRDQVLEKLGGR